MKKNKSLKKSICLLATGIILANSSVCVFAAPSKNIKQKKASVTDARPTNPGHSPGIGHGTGPNTGKGNKGIPKHSW